MDITDYFSIGRPLDFSYKTNKAIAGIILLALLIGIIVGMINNSNITEILFKAFLFSLSVFFTWAFARELDPDNDYSAFLGVILVFSMLYIWQDVNYIMVFWFLIGVRTINRTTGLPVRIVDVSIFLIFSLILGYYVGPEFGLLCSSFLFVDLMFDRNQKFEIVFILISLISFVIFFLINGFSWFSNPITIENLWILVVFTSIFLIVIVTTKKIQSKCDITKVPLTTNRVKAAQFIVLLALLVIVLLYGNNGFSDTFILWCAVGGVGIYRIGKIITNIRK